MRMVYIASQLGAYGACLSDGNGINALSLLLGVAGLALLGEAVHLMIRMKG